VIGSEDDERLIVDARLFEYLDKSTDRLALQLAVVAKALRKSVPSFARASMCGVTATVSP